MYGVRVSLYRRLVRATHPTVVRVIRPHQKESRKDQEPAGLSFSGRDNLTSLYSTIGLCANLNLIQSFLNGWRT